MAGSGWPIAFKETVSAVTATKPTYIGLGTLRYEANEIYQYVYNGGGEQIAPTYGCTLQSGSTNYTVTITSIASYTVGFGLVKNATITTGTYGWVLKMGIATFEGGTASHSIQGGLVMGADGVFEPAKSYQAAGTGTTVDAINICGVSRVSMATGASGLGYFNFL